MPPAPQLHITTVRALTAIDSMIEQGVFDNVSDAMNQIGVGQGNATRIKKGTTCFTIPQLQEIADRGKISMDYIFGYSSQMYRKPSRTLVELLEEATRAAKAQKK